MCNPVEAPIWMGDFTFKPIGDIKIGDVVIGWERESRPQQANPLASSNFERMKRSTVLAVNRRIAPVVKVTMESGRQIRCTPDHLWSNGATYRAHIRWVNPKIGRTLRRVVDVYPNEPPDLRLAGWLGGIFDGEGSSNVSAPTIHQSKPANPAVHSAIERALQELGFQYGISEGAKTDKSKFGVGADTFYILGGKSAYARFLTWCRPYKNTAFDKIILKNLEGKSDRIVDIEYDGEEEVVSMQTTTGNYIAWGYASKNCKLDFHYWAERYAALLLGGINETGMSRGLKLWESQRIILQTVGKLEELCWEAFNRGEPVDGILICLNKARQLGASQISRSLIMHRLTLWDHAAGFSASVDDDKVAELYQRDKRIYDNLPFYLRPSLDPNDGSIDQQSAFLRFGKLDSSILYQTSNQKSGLGQGRKFDVYHITECASFEFDGRGFAMLEHDLFPTIPQTPYTFCIAESTPQGRGTAWHLWCELIESGMMARWTYLFVPVYVEKDAKYRRTPPIDWTPNATTLAYAQKVEMTSPQVIGYKFIPARDHLYWYETTRKEYAERGTLNIFLTNFSATSSESFQFQTDAAFSADLLLDLERDIVEPVTYEFEPNYN